MEHIVGIWAWRGRLRQQAHSGLFETRARFRVVARDARANHIFPDMLAIARARDDVVKRQLLGFFPAVLAGEPITIEYRLS